MSSFFISSVCCNQEVQQACRLHKISSSFEPFQVQLAIVVQRFWHSLFAMPGAAPISKRQQKREKAAKQKMAAEKPTGLQLDFTCTKLPNRVYVEPDKQHPAQMIESWLSHKQDAVSLFYGHLDIRAGDCIALQPDPNCCKSISASLGQVTSLQFLLSSDDV